MLNAVWVDELDSDDTQRVLELLRSAQHADGRPDLPADGGLPAEFADGAHMLARVGAELVGYAHLDTRGDHFGRQVAELIVHPQRRQHGYATAMVQSLVDKTEARKPDDRLRVWSHGDHPAAAKLAARAGFRRARGLLVMRAEVADQAVPTSWGEPALPSGLSLRAFVPGQDEQALIEVNSSAFDWHPEQASMTVEELRATQQESWFDPAGFFLAEDAGGRLLGFHWTKVHPPNPNRFGGQSVGEVYVVGVHPAAQGSGLGKALTIAGLRYLQARGLGQIILYVEGDNTAAVAMYERLGFRRHEVDVQYAR